MGRAARRRQQRHHLDGAPTGVNTPQFSWCETALSGHPQPVQPIYQPELAAARIVEVVIDARRSTVLGSDPTSVRAVPAQIGSLLAAVAATARLKLDGRARRAALEARVAATAPNGHDNQEVAP